KLHGALHPGATGLLNLQFLLAAALMILPTLGLGAMFPITMAGLNCTGSRGARVVGWAYALNTLGAIVGSVAAGFWLVPQLGSQKTLLGGIALNTILGLAAILVAMPVRLARLRPAFALITLLFCGNLFYSTPAW